MSPCNLDLEDFMTSTLRLYIAGGSDLAANAVRNFSLLYRSHLLDTYDFEIIDVLLSPDAAERDNVFVTPTLIEATMHGERRFIGDFSETSHLLRALSGAPSASPR